MQTSIKYVIVLVTITMVTLLYSCSQHQKEEDGHNHEKLQDETKAGSEVVEDEMGLHLTKKQMETIGLEFGDFTALKVKDFVKATGTLGLPPNAYSSVTAKAEGIIRGNKKFVEGNYIKKGNVIAFVENADFIIKQQEYLEAKAQLKLKKLNLERQTALVDADAGVTKNLQNAEAEVAILEVKATGLEKQLSFLGISSEGLTPNTISQQIAIVAPMSGYITAINMHNGMYAQPSVSLMEIISDDHLHLELDVFEKDIASVEVGQKVSYSIPALGNTQYEGEVSIIGKEFDIQTKTLRIHGHLEGEKPQFLKDLFINAKIWLNDNIVNAIPEEAIIKDGESSFIYVANNLEEEETEFSKIMVIPGASDNGYTAIKPLSKIPEGMKIVTKGAYYVYAQSKAGILEHEH